MVKRTSIEPGDGLFDFYERLSYHQIDLRDKLNTKFQIFLIGAIPLMGYLASLLSRINPIPIDTVPLFGIIGLFALIAIVLAGWFFVLSYWGNTYAFMAYASDIEGYRKHPDITPQDFRKYLLEDMIDTASKNAKINDLRSNRIHHGNGLSIVATILTLLASTTYWFTDLDKNVEHVNVSIIQPLKVEGLEQYVSKQTPSPTASPETQPPPSKIGKRRRQQEKN